MTKMSSLQLAKKISGNFPQEPANEHIHLIVSLPETTGLITQEQKLLNQIAELKKSSIILYIVCCWL